MDARWRARPRTRRCWTVSRRRCLTFVEMRLGRLRGINTNAYMAAQAAAFFSWPTASWWRSSASQAAALHTLELEAT